MSNRQIIRALKACKAFLDTSRECKDSSYVCDAVENAYDYKLIDENEVRAAHEYIHELLEGRSTAGEWLRNQGITGTCDHRSMQSWRHRWIDHMIKELQKDVTGS